MYDLIISGGTVLDPCQGINKKMDVAVSAGKIAAVSKNIPVGNAAKVIRAMGKTVTPGLIDFHCHVADGVIPLGAPADRAGVLHGVTCVNDGGSTGYINFTEFREKVIDTVKTDVFCFLNIASNGLATMPEIKGRDDINIEATLHTASENYDVIRGIKLRAVESVAKSLGLEAVRIARKVADESGIPLMVHIGDIPEADINVTERFVLQMLSLLAPGDILAHVYTNAVGSVIKPGRKAPRELTEAIARGVLLDTAHGRPNLSFTVAREGINQGILPDFISSDLANTNIDGPIYSLTLTMSKFLALGLTLEQVVRMTTINPARTLRENSRGTIKVGFPADITILELAHDDFTFNDGLVGNTIRGDTLIIPCVTVKNGIVISTAPNVREELG